ncbi:MAG TPA: Smr/MutS family protein [Woeseiaceae bacterium]|nr:Smr/MutS family protein [Woeseiaceae bacterium]
MSNDDSDLFLKAVRDARPIKAKQRVSLVRVKPPPRARFTRADEQAALSESLEADIDEFESNSGEALHFKRASVGRRTMQKLARGKFSVQAEIDLHGMTAAQARVRLADFIDDMARSGKSCVRVVHGKGRGSGQRGAVLKSGVNRWLRRLSPVLAFTSTRQVDGGTGAVYVLLKT